MRTRTESAVLKDGGVEPGAPVEDQRCDEYSREQQEEPEKSRLHLHADLEQKTNPHDQRREEIAHDDGLRPIGKQEKQVFHELQP
jgi:hypothetical protein